MTQIQNISGTFLPNKKLDFHLMKEGCTLHYPPCEVRPNPGDLSWFDDLIPSGATSSSSNSSTSGTNNNSCELSIDKFKAAEQTPSSTSRIKKIVFHHTAGRFEVAKQMFISGIKGTSAHYLIRKDGKVIQLVEDQNIAFHAGSANDDSIGIEIEHMQVNGKWEDFTKEEYSSLAILSRILADKYNIPIDRQHFIGHKEVPGSNTLCPMNLNIDKIVADTKALICDGSSSNSSTSSGTNISGLPYCDEEPVSEEGDNDSKDFYCLVKKVADFINSNEVKGERISAEALLAIKSVESGGPTNCKYKGEGGVCTGDSNQIAYSKRNSSYVVVKGITQFTTDTFKGLINSAETTMEECTAAIGATNMADPDIPGSKYSRTKVGHALCATAILLSRYGKKYNGGENADIKTWNEPNSQVLIDSAQSYNGGENHEPCLESAPIGSKSRQCYDEGVKAESYVQKFVKKNVFSGCP
jgi:hypothetical protein